MHWLKFELKLLFSGIAAKLGLTIILICSLLSIHLGDLSYQQVRHDQVTAKAKFEQTLEAFKQRDKLPSAGHMGYYAFGATDWQLSPWASLFVGQSQTAFAAMPVRALALQGQIYNREMLNPSWQKAGRLDLGFVLIYLLPLMLGILSVTILTEERQANRWRMLNALENGGSKLIWRRLALTTSCMLLLGWGIILLATFWIGITPDARLLWLLLALATYLLFWSLVIATIIRIGKTCVFNTLSFMFVWLVVTVLIPASIQLYLAGKYNAHPALYATLEQRMIMNDGWDKDRAVTFDQFTAQYPQYQDHQPPESSGSWEWYYAQQHMSDVAVTNYWQAHLLQQQQRQKALSTLSYLSPSLLFQLAVNNIAGSSTTQQLEYQQQVADYHRQIREHLYQYLYGGEKITTAAIDDYPRFTPTSSKPQLPFMALLMLLLLITIGAYRLTRALK